MGVELAIMIEVVTEEMHGRRTEFLTSKTIASEPWLDRHCFNYSEMARSSEVQAAVRSKKRLAVADIVIRTLQHRPRLSNRCVGQTLTLHKQFFKPAHSPWQPAQAPPLAGLLILWFAVASFWISRLPRLVLMGSEVFDAPSLFSTVNSTVVRSREAGR